MVGLTGYGGYVPNLRLNRKVVASTHAWIAPNLMGKGKGERSVGNWDEDAVTMAVEACRDCLGDDDDRSHIDALYFASTTMPFADRLNSGIIASALTLETGTQAVDVANTQRAGTSALIEALNKVEAGGASHALVVASDMRKARAASAQELDFGDGAACFTVGKDNILAEFVGSHSVTHDFVDHFRGDHEEFDYNWEERWVRDEGLAKIVPEAIQGVLSKTGVAPGDINHIVMPCLFPRVPQSIAKTCGLNPEALHDTLAAVAGDTGAAHSSVLLAKALETAKAGEKILVLHFGQGCDALIFSATDKINSFSPRHGISGWLAHRREETNYMKYLTFRGLIEWEKGMRAEKDNKTALTTLYRNNDMIMGLVGGRCTETGVIQFPRSRISINPNNPTVDTQEPYKFAEKVGKILSWSADALTFSMAPPNHFGMVTFEEGGRIMMDITDVVPGEVESGMDVRMVFRIKDVDEQRGFKRYFWKAAPAELSAGAQSQAAE